MKNKKLQGNNPLVIFDPWDDTYLHNYKLEEHGMIDLNPINILMKTGGKKTRYPCHHLRQTSG